MTRNWIVTAAHCVKDVSPSNLLVRVGEYNTLDTREIHKHTDRRISRSITHINFDKVYKYLIAKKGIDETKIMNEMEEDELQQLLCDIADMDPDNTMLPAGYRQLRLKFNTD